MKLNFEFLLTFDSGWLYIIYMKKLILILLPFLFLGCKTNTAVDNYVLVQPELQLVVPPYPTNNYLLYDINKEFICNWKYIYNNQDKDVDVIIKFTPEDSFEIISKDNENHNYKLKAVTSGVNRITIISDNGTSSTSLPIHVN